MVGQTQPRLVQGAVEPSALQLQWLLQQLSRLPVQTDLRSRYLEEAEPFGLPLLCTAVPLSLPKVRPR